VADWHRADRAARGTLGRYDFRAADLDHRADDFCRWAGPAGHVPDNPSAWNICLRSLVCGIGFGCFQSPNNREMLSNVAREYASYASGVLSIVRTFGQCLGAAAVGVRRRPKIRP
jgi:hypothetical protein